jgi:hypothetical protein
MNGFKNAPGITAFKCGMRIRWGDSGLWKTVMWVGSSGNAYCRLDDGSSVDGAGLANIGRYTLDLHSIWEGRRHRLKRSVVLQDCPVVFANNELVTYQCGSDDFSTVDRAYFLCNYEPIPLPEPTVEKPAETKWKPGDDALIASGTLRVHIHATHGQMAWCEDEDHAFYSRAFGDLSPLPPAEGKEGRK